MARVVGAAPRPTDDRESVCAPTGPVHVVLRGLFRIQLLTADWALATPLVQMRMNRVVSCAALHYNRRVVAPRRAAGGKQLLVKEWRWL